jgi:hypothetical protein
MKRSAMLLLVLVVAACTKVNYIGDSFPPTTHVDIFFDEVDVEYDYKVMGHVDATAADWIDTEEIMEAIKRKAMEKGADGIIVLGLDQNVVGETTTYKGETKAEGDKIKETGTTTTSTTKENEVRAIFIKYKSPKKKLKVEEE